MLNVFNLLQWCFDRLSPARSPHSGVNVSPRMAVPDQGFTWAGLPNVDQGSWFYEIRGKLQIQILCGADDNPRRRMNTGRSNQGDPDLTLEDLRSKLGLPD